MATLATLNKPSQRYVGKAYETTSLQGMEFDEVRDLFLRSRRMGVGGANTACRERTIYEYKYDLDRFIAYMRNLNLTHYNEMNRSHVVSYIDELTSNDKLKDNSKRKVLRSLKAFFRWVADDEECSRERMVGWAGLLPKIGKNTPRLYIPTPDVMYAFISGFDQTYRWGLRDYVATALMLDCGARIGEVCWLRLDDIKWDQNLLHLPKEGKTNERWVPFDPVKTGSLLRRWLRQRERFAPKESPWLFLSRNGKRMSVDTFDQSFADNRERTGLGVTPEGNLTPHTVRHFFCTYYLINGGTLHGLKAITGHSSFDTLQIYVHLAQQRTFLQEEHAKFSPFKSLENLGRNTKKTKT